MKKCYVLLMALAVVLVGCAPLAMADTGGVGLNASTIALVAVGAALLAFVVTFLAMPYAIKRGMDVSGMLSGADATLKTAQGIVDGLQGIMPDAKGLAVVDKIIEYTQKGVNSAEQMYFASQIEAAQREKEAKKIACGLLEIAGIAVTPEIDTAIDGCLAAAVRALPRTSAVLAAKNGVA